MLQTIHKYTLRHKWNPIGWLLCAWWNTDSFPRWKIGKDFDPEWPEESFWWWYPTEEIHKLFCSDRADWYDIKEEAKEEDGTGVYCVERECLRELTEDEVKNIEDSADFPLNGACPECREG